MLRLLLLISLLVSAGCNADRVARLEKQNQELTAKLDATLKAVSLDSQAKCAQGAAASFKTQGWDKPDPGTYVSYTNHFNQRVNKCFILTKGIDTTKGSVMHSSALIDAFEGKEFGSYMQFVKDKLVVSCWVMADGVGKDCKTKYQYDELVKPYMEQ